MSLKLLSKKSKHRILVALILLVGAVASFGVFSYGHSQAQSAGLTPFGGQVLSSFWCKCSHNYLLTVSGPAGGLFVYTPGTQAYESFNLGPLSGMWVLGLYTPGVGVCSALEGECFTIPTQGLISPTVGSSLTF